MWNKIKNIKIFGTQEEKDLPFAKDEKGRDIYYLWCKGGEYFYINKRQKLWLSLLLIGIFITIFPYPILYVYIDFNNIEYIYLSDYLFLYLSDYIFSLLVAILSAFYILCMFSSKRVMALSPVPFSERKVKYKVLFVYLGLIMMQSPILALVHYDGITVLTFAWIAYMLFITLFFIRLYRTKGHYFSG